jgi:hypothetical protein
MKSGNNQVSFQRLVLFELGDTHDAETNDATLRVHTFHHGIVLGLLNGNLLQLGGGHRAGVDFFAGGGDLLGFHRRRIVAPGASVLALERTESSA